MEQKSDKETKPVYIKRVEKINPEKQLTDALTKKFGKRFSDYREKYFKVLNSPKNNYDYIPEYPLNVLVEVVNKCNLECPMCPRIELLEKNFWPKKKDLSYNKFVKIFDPILDNCGKFFFLF